MNITSVFYLCLACLLIFQLLVLPLLRKRIAGATGADAIAAYAAFHMFSILRTVAFAFLAGAALVGALVWSYNRQDPVTAAQASLLRDQLQGLRDLAVGVDTSLTVIAVAALVGGLCWLSYVQARQKAGGLLASVQDEEYQRVLAAGARGEWGAMPPTDDMREIESLVQHAGRQIHLAIDRGDKERVKQLEQERELLALHLLRSDAIRRMQAVSVQLDTDLALPASASRMDRLRQFIVNRGVLKTLQGGSRIGAFVGLVSLLPASLAFNLATAADSVEARHMQLDALRIDLALRESQRDLDQASAAAPPPLAPASAADDDAAEEEIVERYDESFGSALLARSLAAPVHATLARATVRERILRDLAGSAAHLEVVPGNAPGGDDVLAQARRQLREQVHLIRENNRAGWDALKAAFPVRDDFATPVTRSELRRAMVGELAREAFGNAGEQLAAAYRGHANEVLSSTIRGMPADGAIKRSFDRGGAFWTAQADQQLLVLQQRIDPDGNPVDRAMRDHPPTLRAQGPPPSTLAQAEAIMRDMPDMPDLDNRTAALYGFDDLLPGHLGQELDTPAARVANSLDPARASELRHAESSAAAHKRSYSYQSLRGFARVGGVLIGRSPDDGSPVANLVAMAWEFTAPASMTISLTTAAGARHRFGPYPVSMVRQALGYAADQRPLSVTMISGNPIPDLKIITHPILIDTAVGCRAVQLDRLADMATSDAPYRERADNAARASNALYRLAWAVVVEKATARLDSAEPAQAEKRSALEALAAKTAMEARGALPQEAKTLREVLGGDEDSPMKAKPAFYLPALASLASRCAQANPDLQAVRQCVEDAPLPTADLDLLLSKIPEFQIWSGVRELPYRIDAGLQFLKPAENDKLWPFDFILQTAFTKYGFIGPEVIDPTPWEFPALHDRLVGDVRKLVASDRRHASVIADMRNFTVLQRLFRAALGGQLGERFPVERLALLSQELKKFPAPPNNYKTPRWNTTFATDARFNGLLQAIASEYPIRNVELKKILTQVSQRIDACAKKRDAQARTRRGAPASSDTACDFKEFARRAKAIEQDARTSEIERQIAGEIRSIAGIQALRGTLGLFDPANLNPPACPTL